MLRVQEALQRGARLLRSIVPMVLSAQLLEKVLSSFFLFMQNRIANVCDCLP